MGIFFRNWGFGTRLANHWQAGFTALGAWAELGPSLGPPAQHDGLQSH